MKRYCALALIGVFGLSLPACDNGSSSGTGSLAAACTGHSNDGINREAIALTGTDIRKGCEQLHHYNLFEPAEVDGDFSLGDPRRPVEGGIPFNLNARLFSDYTLKHRAVFLPVDTQGALIPATFRAADGDVSKAQDNFLFPVGTVITKTFTYPDTSSGTPTERIIETRLLIKHDNHPDGERWEGLPYIWQQDTETGQWTASLASFGGRFHDGEWHYPELNKPGNIISGESDEFGYTIPDAAQCRSCHRNRDQEPGVPPIGLKARMLNRPYASEFGEFATAPHGLEDHNQIDFWLSQGWLEGVEPEAYSSGMDIIPEIAHIQPFNLPANPEEPEADLTERVRGYLMANCAHCHNPGGRRVNNRYFEDLRDLCDPNFVINVLEPPIKPGEDAMNSSAFGRMARRARVPEGEDPVYPESAMPQIGRQLIHIEGRDMLREWIEGMDPAICDND